MTTLLRYVPPSLALALLLILLLDSASRRLVEAIEAAQE